MRFCEVAYKAKRFVLRLCRSATLRRYWKRLRLSNCCLLGQMWWCFAISDLVNDVKKPLLSWGRITTDFVGNFLSLERVSAPLRAEVAVADCFGLL